MRNAVIRLQCNSFEDLNLHPGGTTFNRGPLHGPRSPRGFSLFKCECESTPKSMQAYCKVYKALAALIPDSKASYFDTFPWGGIRGSIWMLKRRVGTDCKSNEWISFSFVGGASLTLSLHRVTVVPDFEHCHLVWAMVL